MRYRAELHGNPALEQLRAIAAERPITLVYAAHDPRRNHALLLKDVLEHGL